MIIAVGIYQQQFLSRNPFYFKKDVTLLEPEPTTIETLVSLLYEKYGLFIKILQISKVYKIEQEWSNLSYLAPNYIPGAHDHIVIQRGSQIAVKAEIVD